MYKKYLITFCFLALNSFQILDLFKERGYLNVVNAPERVGDVRHTLADTRRLKGLGWTAKIKILEGLKEVLDYWDL